MNPRRYLRQRFPWIEIEASDLIAQSDPETVVFLPNRTSLVGLHVKGLDEGHVMLGIREDERGHPLSCLVTNELAIDTAAPQSNPRRITDGADSA